MIITLSQEDSIQERLIVQSKDNLLYHPKGSCSDFDKLTPEWLQICPLHTVIISVLPINAACPSLILSEVPFLVFFSFLSICTSLGSCILFFWVFLPNWLKRRRKAKKPYFSLINLAIFFFLRFLKSKVYSDTNLLFIYSFFIAFWLSPCYTSFSHNLPIFPYLLCLPLIFPCFTF